MDSKRKTLLINEELHKRFSEYCKKEGLVMINLTERIISDFLKKVVK
jgi:hypothetical protein